MQAREHDVVLHCRRAFVPRLVIAWAINLAALWAADALWTGSASTAGGFPDRLGRPRCRNAVLKPLLTI